MWIRRTGWGLIATLSILFCNSAYALEPVYSSFIGGAIRGYDPVAYFTRGEPVKGSNDFSLEWQDAKWKFSSEENKALFIANPEKYTPQYGGYCAWAASQGYTASTDPNAWTIHNGRLYLNYSKSVQQTWSKDIPGNIRKGNTNWPQLLVN